MAERRGRHDRRVLVLGSLVTVAANGAAAGVVLLLLLLVVPLPDAADPLRLDNVLLSVAYLPAAVLVGTVVGTVRVRRRLAWLRRGEQPTDRQRRRTIGIPLAVTVVQLSLWLLAAVLFAAYNGPRSGILAMAITVTILIGGLVASALTYLLVEQVNQPVLAVALADAGLEATRGSGVAWRTFVMWLLGSALPVAGLVLLNAIAIGIDVDRVELAISGVVLGSIALVVGLVVILVHARSISRPLKGLRRAVARVSMGDTHVRVPVSDATEVGILQTGFNQMVQGLADRDRIRDILGRHVGQDVARRALEEGVELGGEVRDVAVLFVDVTGSTAMAEREGAVATVERLNELFGVVVEVAEAAGGTVTHFAGDAALCVWGAPLTHPRPASAALRAGRELASRLAADPGTVAAGVGVAAGPVVAGNVGAAQRVEYTVIGDAVNTAARLSDLAKEREEGVVATAGACEAAAAEGTGEDQRWRGDGEATLRGRSTPTSVVVPVT